MSKKSFEEWFHLENFHNEYDCDQVTSAKMAWNFCASQYESEVEGLKTKFSEATQTYTDDIDGLEKQNEELRKKLEEAVKLIRFINSRDCPSGINERTDEFLRGSK